MKPWGSALALAGAVLAALAVMWWGTTRLSETPEAGGSVASAPPQVAALETVILGAPEPGEHGICVFVAYRGDGVAMPVQEAADCGATYRERYVQADRRVSARAQAHADSLCFQFTTAVPGLGFRDNPSCAGQPPQHVWRITLSLRGPSS